MPDQEQHIDAEDARGGSTPHIVRYVLLISVGLVVAAFAVILAIGTK